MAVASDRVVTTSGEEGPRVEELAQLGLFASLDEATLRLLARRLRVRDVGVAEVVYEEGQAGRAMFVVLHGEVGLFKQSPGGNDTQVATARSGDWFGEMALLDVMARPVTVRASQATRLLMLCPTDLDAVYRSNIKMYALLVMNMARQLSRKLRTAEQTLANALTSRADRDDGPR